MPIIAELKMQMIDDTEENRKVLIRVHEEVNKNGYLDQSNRILLDKIRLSLVGYKNFKEMRQKVYGDLL